MLAAFLPVSPCIALHRQTLPASAACANRSATRLQAIHANASKRNPRKVRLFDANSIPMYVPPLTSQKKIVALFNLHLENQALGAQMAIRRATKLQDALLHIAALQESECSL